jgi:hypothetical protein
VGSKLKGSLLTLDATPSAARHVIQYPNRPFYRPYDLPSVARVKPNNKMLELEYALPSEWLDQEVSFLFLTCV